MIHSLLKDPCLVPDHPYVVGWPGVGVSLTELMSKVFWGFFSSSLIVATLKPCIVINCHCMHLDPVLLPYISQSIDYENYIYNVGIWFLFSCDSCECETLHSYCP